MKIAHIVSHSHWDREWYMPYESHHMRLVMLIDQVLDAIENDPDFKSFHLDGQTICIDDYLQVKPDNKEKLFAAIKDGKIKIGPWYILQDAFLTSAEAQIRNGYYGNKDCLRYGNKSSLGYFPDTFGIYSQAPQILKNLEIENMIFGRGVTSTGFNNETSNEFESKYSEMLIEASDGTQVLGILFANWYNNGDEIPTEPEKAKKYWDVKIKEASQYTKCNNLLFMNGCDHTPFQEDVTKAIQVANELYPDIEFRHSTIEDYLENVKLELDFNSMSKVEGELISQATSGYYTLVNTASSRINQKIKNAYLQQLYEQIIEPMCALYSKEKYPHEEIEYGWKKIMQNHPHDSICGCSVDSVHKSMDTRFEDALHVGEHVIARQLKHLRENIYYDKDELAFTIVNPMTNSCMNHEIHLEAKRFMFGSNFEEAREKAYGYVIPNYVVCDLSGKQYNASITDMGPSFGYVLPDDKFRRAYFSRNIKIEFHDSIPNFSHKTFYLEETKDTNEKNTSKINKLENEFILIEVNEDCTINITNKILEKTQCGLLEIVDEGDIGNEYMFGSVKNDKYIKINPMSKIEYEQCGDIHRCRIYTSLDLPVSADSQKLNEEQMKLVEYYKRTAERSPELCNMPITIDLSLSPNDLGVEVSVDFENIASDHRLRVIFSTDISSKTHKADSAFEIVNRPNKPLDVWENPNEDNRMFKFVQLRNERESFIVATHGLHEYEILQDGKLAITILRATGELGDWGYFPTPDAQSREKMNIRFKLFYTANEQEFDCINESRNLWVKMPYTQIYKNSGTIPCDYTNLDIVTKSHSYISSLKNNSENELVLRLASNGRDSSFKIDNVCYKTNFLENKKEPLNSKIVKKNEILTIILDKKISEGE